MIYILEWKLQKKKTTNVTNLPGMPHGPGLNNVMFSMGKHYSQG